MCLGSIPIRRPIQKPPMFWLRNPTRPLLASDAWPKRNSFGHLAKKCEQPARFHGVVPNVQKPVLQKQRLFCECMVEEGGL